MDFARSDHEHAASAPVPQHSGDASNAIDRPGAPTPEPGLFDSAWPDGERSDGAPALTGAAAAAAATAEGRPARLLLFVGTAVRPEAPLASLLAREGLRCLGLPGAEQAVRAASLARFDAVLVDAALVDGRAIEALATAHRCPIVVLADEADEVDEIVALELGADRYLARPLAPRRLRAHLRALLRRGAALGERPREPDSDRAALGGTARSPAFPGDFSWPHANVSSTAPLQAGGWTLEPARQRLTRGARAVRLSHAQAAMLRCLMRAGGDIVPPEDLLASLPSHERLQMRSLRVHVHRLRQRLREEGVDELQVEAVRGSGYALALPCAQAA